MHLDNNTRAFFALVKAGLWEQDVHLTSFNKIEFQEINRLAEEQTVVGLVAAGLEHVTDMKVSKEDLLQFVGRALQLEQRNESMNSFVGCLVKKMRENGIYALLLKGQGIAQCYERPQWRAPGDVDFFSSEDNYKKAFCFLSPLASSVENENTYNKHIAMHIESFAVELHGTLRNGLWYSMDNALDSIQNEIFFGGAVRSWMNNSTQLFLPRADEDVVYVFSHILQHFYQEGVGLRQVCDWCRLLWTYKSSLNYRLLESRIRKMGILSEWKAFATLSVDYLGMPKEAMPFYSSSKIWKYKANRIVAFILKTGNFGHNRDYSYYERYPYLVYKGISLWKHIVDFFKYFRVFPLNAMKVLRSIIINGASQVRRSR